MSEREYIPLDIAEIVLAAREKLSDLSSGINQAIETTPELKAMYQPVECIRGAKCFYIWLKPEHPSAESVCKVSIASDYFGECPFSLILLAPNGKFVGDTCNFDLLSELIVALRKLAKIKKVAVVEIAGAIEPSDTPQVATAPAKIDRVLAYIAPTTATSATPQAMMSVAMVGGRGTNRFAQVGILRRPTPN